MKRALVALLQKSAVGTRFNSSYLLLVRQVVSRQDLTRGGGTTSPPTQRRSLSYQRECKLPGRLYIMRVVRVWLIFFPFLSSSVVAACYCVSL